MNASSARRLIQTGYPSRSRRAFFGLRGKTENVFPRMVKILPPGKVGVAEIAHIRLTEDEAKFANLRSLIHGRRDELVEPGRYAILKVNGGLVMSDTQMEQRTNREFLFEARGRVLIAGLGIGLILHPLMKKDGVTEVTVVEKCPDVVTLVAPTLPRAVRVETADIFEWRPERGARYDTIYFDIWPDICPDNLNEIRTLKKTFRCYLAPGGWMGAWKERMR